jgi:hypothetical protein
MIMEALNQVDLAFVVDTTGSMGAFIDAARRQMTDMLRALTSRAAVPIQLRVGVVEYRDHPPQDHTFVTRSYEFTDDLAQTQWTIDRLKPDGGGDGPEAVYDGLQSACQQLAWRGHCEKLALLVGDAPPHGWVRRGDGFPDGCPCKLTPETVTALFEQKGITLYALGLTAAVNASFAKLARYTGGEFFPANQGNDAIQMVEKLLAQEFCEIGFDQQVFEYCAKNPAWSVESLGEALASPRARLSAALSRLGRRGLLG